MSDLDDARSVAFRFIDAINVQQPELLSTVFTLDAVWLVPGLEPIVGRPAIQDTISTMLVDYESMFQFLQGGDVTINGDTAAGRWYWREWGRAKSGGDSRLFGLYDDEMVKTEQGWRIRRRSGTLLYRGRHESVGRFYPPAPARPTG